MSTVSSQGAVMRLVVVLIAMFCLLTADAVGSPRTFAKHISASPKAQRYLKRQLMRYNWNAGLRRRMITAIRLFARHGHIPSSWCARRSRYGTGSSKTRHNTWVCERARVCVAVGGMQSSADLHAKIRACVKAATRLRG